MALRTAHGVGAGNLLCVETSPPDELPVGVAAEARCESPADRGPRGTFAPGNTLARRGGLAKAGRGKLSGRLGLASLPEGNEFRPYKTAAATFRRAQCAALAQTIGGGFCGPGPSSIIATAAVMLAWSRFFSDRAAATGDFELASRAGILADRSRVALLTAHELCAREAAARPKKDMLAAFRDSLDADAKTSTDGDGA